MLRRVANIFQHFISDTESEDANYDKLIDSVVIGGNKITDDPTDVVF